jgi:hypothetical protein
VHYKPNSEEKTLILKTEGGIPCGRVIAKADSSPVTFDEIGETISTLKTLVRSSYFQFREALVTAPLNPLFPLLLSSFPPSGPSLGWREGERSIFDSEVQRKYCEENSVVIPKKSALIERYWKYLNNED